MRHALRVAVLVVVLLLALLAGGAASASGKDEERRGEDDEPIPALEPVCSSGSNDDVGPVRQIKFCLLYTSPSPRDGLLSRMPSSA